MDSLLELIAGASAGAFSKTLLAPLDRLKLVVQLRGSLKAEPTKNNTTGIPTTSGSSLDAYQSGRLALANIIREEGFLALWRGNVATVLIQGGTTGINFMFLDLFKKAADNVIVTSSSTSTATTTTSKSPQDDRKERLAKSFVSGGLAGVTAMTLLYPLGLMRTKLALDMGRNTQQRQYPNGMRDVIRTTFRANGIPGLYQGYGVALWSVTLYRMVHLGGYDFCKTELLNWHQISTGTRRRQVSSATMEIPFWERMLAAQGVSILASTIHYPLDSVRRRLMMQSDATTKIYRNGIHCIVDIYQKEGIPGYFRGIGVNYARSFSAAIVLVSYDMFRWLMDYNTKIM